MKNEDGNVRANAASALGSMRAAAKTPVPALIEALKDADSKVRASGVSAKVAIPALIKASKDKDSDVRMGAAIALGDMGVETSSVVPILVQALENPYVRRRAADALGHIGSEASSAVPALTEALKDRDSELRASAASALEKIAPGSQ